MKLDTLNNFNGIDLSTCITGDEKIEKILKTDREEFVDLFNSLSEQDKNKYFKYLPTYYMKLYLANKPDEFIFNFIINEFNNIDEYAINSISSLIKDEQLKAQIIIFLADKINTIYIILIIESIKDEILKMKIIEQLIKCNIEGWYLADIINFLNDDKNKELFLDYLSIDDQVKVITNFKDVELLKQYALKKEFSYYRSELISATKDNDFIKEQFLTIPFTRFRHNLISLVEDEELKIELISLITDEQLKYFLLSNLDKYYDSYLEDINEQSIINTNIDENITIGVELECCNTNYGRYKWAKTVLKDFNIVSDSSVNSGFEIVSPVLHYNVEDLKQLKSVCKILKECNFYTDYSCGGHIHIGADYLKSIEDIYMLIYIYTNCENIIYKICNKEHSKSRRNINKYAHPIKNIYLKESDKETLNDKLTLNDLIDYLKFVNGTRYKGLNIKNMNNTYKNTIEFRMPNGEIEFEELLYNIKLFAKLIQIAHELANINEKDSKRKMINLISLQMPEQDRLEILLNILFENEDEKVPYRNRYYSNTNVIESIKSDLFYKKEKLIEIDKDNKKLLRKK